MVKDDLVYVIPAGQYGKEGVLALLEQLSSYLSSVSIWPATIRMKRFLFPYFSTIMKNSSTARLCRLMVLLSYFPGLLHCRTLASI